MDLFELKYFKICRLHLLAIGQWPYQRKITAAPARFIISVQLISFGYEKISFLRKLGNDVRIIIEDIPYCCISITLIAMYISFWVKLEMLKEILEKVKGDWHCAILNKEDHILEAITKQGWIKSIYFLWLTYILASLYMILLFAPNFLSNLFPWNSTNIREPFLGTFLLDQNKNYPLHVPYEYSLVIQTVLLPSVMYVQFNMLVMHACGMITIFGQRLEHAFQNTSEEGIKDDRVHTVFVRIIEQHKQIMQYIDSLNSYYASLTFFICLLSVLTVSSLLVNVCTYLRNEGNIEMAVTSLLTLGGVFFTGYYFCDSAQELLNVSSHVFRQTYYGKWYTASISNQKILLLIMCNCIQPTVIAFSSIFTMSLETFYVIWRIIKLGNNLKIFIEDIPYTLLWFCIVIMHGCDWFHSDLLKEMLETIKHDWYCAMLNKEDHILDAIMKQGWIKSIYILAVTYATVSIYFTFLVAPECFKNLLPWNSTYNRQPFVGAFLLDPNKHYPLRLPYEIVIVLGTGLTISAMILQFRMLIIHACGMFTIFGHRLEHVFHDNSEKCIKHVRIHTDLVRIMKQHKRIMQYIDNLNSYYAACYCFLAFAFVLISSIFLVNVCMFITAEGKNDLAILTAMNLAAMYFNLYFFCAAAQELLNTSSHVFRQMYWGEWYTASNSNQKILLLIMYKCMQPVTIAFSTIFVVSLETYYVFMEASLSYFTVLYSLQ